MLDQIKNDDIGKLAVRLTVGVLLLFHGAAKILHPESMGFISGVVSGAGLPAVFAHAVYIGEVLAPLMIIAGFYARLGGLLVIINMLFAIGLVHTEHFFTLSPHGGWALELQAFYLLGGLAVVLLGSGKYAVRPD